MNRALAVVVGLLLVAPALTGLVVADGHDHAQQGAVDRAVGEQVREQNSAPNASATSTPSNASSSGGDVEVVAQVDDAVRVVGFDYNAEAEQFSVDLQNTGDVTSTVTLTEVIGRRQAGSGTFGISVVEVAPGETVTATVSSSRVSGTAAVMVLTQRSVLDGRGVFLQESARDGGNLIKGGASGTDVRAAYIGGAGVVLVGMVLGGWQYLAASNQGVRPADVSPKTNIFGRFRK